MRDTSEICKMLITSLLNSGSKSEAMRLPVYSAGRAAYHQSPQENTGYRQGWSIRVVKLGKGDTIKRTQKRAGKLSSSSDKYSSPPSYIKLIYEILYIGSWESKITNFPQILNFMIIPVTDLKFRNSKLKTTYLEPLATLIRSIDSQLMSCK